MKKTNPVKASGVQPVYCTVQEWITMSGMRQNSIYEALHRGDLKGKKSGWRTLIHMPSGLAYLESLPDFRPRQGAA
jgi:hypothetical protein